MNFTAQFLAARRVSTPLLAVQTFDAMSTLKSVLHTFVDDAKADKGGVEDEAKGRAESISSPSSGQRTADEKAEATPIFIWDAMQGMRGLTKGSTLKHDAMFDGNEQDGTIPLTETLRLAKNYSDKHNEDSLLFIHNAHLQWKDEPAVIQGIWNLRDTFKANGNMLVLLISPGAVLPAELVSDVLMMEEPLPTVSELETIVKDTFRYAKLREPSSSVLSKATDALIGLPAFPAEQAAAMCLDYKAKDAKTALNITDLWDRKRQIIGQAPGLSVWQGSERVEDIGGVASVKNFYKRIVEGVDPPKTIIFIDEIEKAFAGTGTELSGVKTELTGAMLSWMQDTEMDGTISIGLPGVSKSQLAKAVGGSYGIPVINFDLAGMQSGLVGSSNSNLRSAQKTVDAISGGRVLAIATCNSITALPPELRRRFNLGIFFFDAPSAEERDAIWDIYRAKYGIKSQEPQPIDDGWTGAEIKECCKKAYRLRMTLTEAAQYVVPVTRSSAEQIRNLRLSCSGKYLSASYPGVYTYDEAVTASKQPSLASLAGGRRMRAE